MKDLEEMLKKLYGLFPYNTWTNICCGDGHFAKSIQEKFSQEDIEKAKKNLGIY